MLEEPESGRTSSGGNKTPVEEDANWDDIKDLLTTWSEQACSNRHKSVRMSILFIAMHYLLGVPVVILASVVGSTAFTQINQQGNDEVRWYAGVLSIISAVLASLQTFFRFAERAEKYRAAGIGYEKVEREIEEILTLPRLAALPNSLRGSVGRRLDALKERMNTLADGAPGIPLHQHFEKGTDGHRSLASISRGG